MGFIQYLALGVIFYFILYWLMVKVILPDGKEKPVWKVSNLVKKLRRDLGYDD
jgi:hypothetical protein